MTDRDKVSAFLQAHVGSYFCSLCVSREVRIDSFTARDLVWQLQQLPGYEMRSAKCVSCGRRKRLIAAVGGFALLGPEAHVVSFLVTNKGFAFCNACVAFANEISLQEAERVLAHLRPLPEFERLAASECSVCARRRPVISALSYAGNAIAPTRLAASGPTVHYHGWRIDVLSYEVAGGWRPFVVIHKPEPATVPEAATLWDPAPTKAEADDHAVTKAREWIDKRL
jgi:hypothetical protein